MKDGPSAPPAEVKWGQFRPSVSDKGRELLTQEHHTHRGRHIPSHAHTYSLSSHTHATLEPKKPDCTRHW